MKHLKSLNYCKRMIKSTSAFGNASKGFASNELAQTDKSLKDQVVKAGLIVVSGALLWANGGAVKQVNAEPWGDGVCRAGWYVDDHYGCVSADGACYYHPNGASNPDCSIGSGNTNNSNGGFDVPTRQKPSSYGAVAWGENALGTSANQTTKQGAVDVALQKCGDSTCKIVAQYSNQCVASTSGLKKNGKYVWQSSFGMTQKKAEQAALRDCSKRAKNCKVFLSECSLP